MRELLCTKITHEFAQAFGMAKIIRSLMMSSNNLNELQMWRVFMVGKTQMFLSFNNVVIKINPDHTIKYLKQ